MRRLNLTLAILIVSLGVSSNAWGWLSTGHRIIAYIAWEDLTPATKAKVSEILKLHPRYEKDLLADMPQGLSEQDIQRYAFASAGTWSDMIRSFANPMHAGYSHPNWHYIDIPFAIKGQAVPAARPAEDSGPRDAVEAFAYNMAQLQDAKTTGPNQAIALCWVLHLVGDIHQPLHAACLYSPQFPNGDAGGNSIIVLREPPYPDSRANLHFIWDSMPGNFQSRDIEGYIAAGLRNDPQYSRQRLQAFLAVKDFAAWAAESHALAVKYAYLDGQINGVSARAKDGDNPIPGLPPGYIKTAEGVANQRLVLAGYRMADLLNGLFGK